jgi:hypothetical protein
MLVAIVILALILSLWVVTDRLGMKAALAAAVLASLCVYPQLLGERLEVYHVGIAPPVPEIRTFTVAIVLALGALTLRGWAVPLPAVWWPLVGWLVLGFGFFWAGTTEQWSGALQYGLAALSWALGVAISRRASIREEKWLATIVLCIVIIQVLVVSLQIAGFPINSVSEADAADLGSRVNGTSNHPNNLGKMLFLLSALVIPLSKSSDSAVRRMSVAAVLLAFIPLAFAEGRANMLAAFLLLLIWIVIQPERSPMPNGRLVVIMSLGAMLASSFVFIARFEQDPMGGARGTLLEVAFRNIPDLWLRGTGPNSYVTYIGARSDTTIPVHNSFLLQFAELGLIGTISFTLPVFALLLRALRKRTWATPEGDYARAFFAAVPGLLIIGMTGWGMLGNNILPLWMFVFGCLYSRIGARVPVEVGQPAASARGALGQL